MTLAYSGDANLQGNVSKRSFSQVHNFRRHSSFLRFQNLFFVSISAPTEMVRRHPSRDGISCSIVFWKLALGRLWIESLRRNDRDALDFSSTRCELLLGLTRGDTSRRVGSTSRSHYSMCLL